MQVIISIAIFIVVVTVIIYKINDRFEKREFAETADAFGRTFGE